MNEAVDKLARRENNFCDEKIPLCDYLFLALFNGVICFAFIFIKAQCERRPEKIHEMKTNGMIYCSCKTVKKKRANHVNCCLWSGAIDYDCCFINFVLNYSQRKTF